MIEKATLAENNLRLLQPDLEGEIVQENGIYSMQVDRKIGSGQVRCIGFNKFMTAMELDLTLRDNTLISFGSIKKNMIYFLYCLEGGCAHKFNVEDKKVAIAELQTAVVYSKKKMSSQLYIEKDRRLIFNVIGIDKTRFDKLFEGNFYGLSAHLKKLFEILCSKEPFHLGKLNLKIGEYVKSLDPGRYLYDLPSFLHFEGVSNLILASQIEQVLREIKDAQAPSSLTKRELQKINEITDFIKNYPEQQHSVNNLCTRTGLSPAKLQEGFKAIHQRTVSDFIRNTRIVKAEQMIRTTDLNISEVVYSIGLTSRSYFCKIFKRKYGCSPKEYKKKALVVPVGA